jgi:hypothetical protein
MSKTRIVIVLLVLAVAVFFFPTLGHAVSPRTLSGLALRDGRPVVLLYDCPHYTIIGVTIEPVPGTDALPEETKGWTVRRSASAPLPKFVPALGAAPPGWTKQDTSALTTRTVGPNLTSLVPGQKYLLGAYDKQDDNGGGPGLYDFEFTVDDVNDLAPGEVLVGYMKTFRKVTEAQFYAGAKDGC